MVSLPENWMIFDILEEYWIDTMFYFIYTSTIILEHSLLHTIIYNQTKDEFIFKIQKLNHAIVNLKNTFLFFPR
jgi:hypothetical protein